jgi:hypothetical protein
VTAHEKRVDGIDIEPAGIVGDQVTGVVEFVGHRWRGGIEWSRALDEIMTAERSAP